MKKAIIKNLQGEKVGETDLPENIFNLENNSILIKEVVVFYQQVKARAGTAKTKNRSEVSGSNRKRRPQKRTGSARMGMRNPVHHRGGSVAFGPNGAIYNPSMNKKKIKKALAILLSEKVKNNNLVLIDKMESEQPKTKLFLESAEKIGVSKKSLFVDKEKNNNFYLSTRNIVGVDFLMCEGINPLSVLRANKLFLSVKALETIKERYE